MRGDSREIIGEKAVFSVFALIVTLFFISAQAFALDYPHFGVNNIGCDSCHYIYGGEPSLLPEWTNHTPTDIDDTAYNTLCWSCHNDIEAPYMRTHSSLQIDDSYGNWTVECHVCHNPHYQKQKEHGSSSYIYSAVSTGVTSTSITETGAGWDDNEYAGYVVMPNTGQNKYIYKITGNTSDTLTVAGPMNMSKVSVGNTFAIMYGNLVNEFIDLSKITITPAKTGISTVRFFKKTGTNSFADGDGTYDGVCEVCHTQTSYHKNDGTGSSHNAATDCTQCHDHSYGFAHGAGGGSINCIECHGHDAGTNYDPDKTAPYAGGGSASQGKGTYVSHSTHTETDSDDIRGPGIYCDGCHDISNFPYFKTGTDANSDGQFSLAETDVCDDCHSPGGTYDGVDDSVIGAKNNWSTAASSTSPVYAGDGSLQSGKDKWCAGCHDEVPSEIGGISAPNVIGDEDGSYTYGTGWGFYKTGHGLPASEAYSYKGGLIEPSLINGETRPVTCDDCHDFTTSHIDGDARSFNDSDGTTDPSVYRIAYRLDLVPISQGTGATTREPMLVPWPSSTANVVNNYRLCNNCHDSGPFLSSSNTDTNLVTGGVNRHEYHLVFNSIQYPSDWSGGNNSLITCVVCHNVHGSTRLAMIRDGKLTGREPGLKIWYKNDAVTINIGTTNHPSPEDLPLAASDGTAWINNTAKNICVGCHNSGNLEGKDRTPFQDTSQAPKLHWIPETGYQVDGANPDSAVSGSTFTFKVKYQDTNNQAPGVIEVWVDEDDDNTYQADEKYSMSAVDSGDTNYTNGKFYSKSLTILSAGDNTLKYRFYATDGTNTATGDPTSDSSIVILNNAPVLSWTGESYYSADGVNPDTGGSGVNFEFRITYTDVDDQAPTSIQVWVDRNDDGDYLDASEKENMTLVGGGDGDYTNGEKYTKTLALSYAGDGNINYLFYAFDGTDAATGAPASNVTLTVLSGANSPPTLEWEAVTCRGEGVKPATGIGGGSFEFFVKYTDPENNCPPGASDIQVWVDLDDDSVYEAGEKYDLTADDAGDTTCSDGKLYKKSMSIALAGDNSLSYRFYASDGTDAATGEGVTGSSLTVVDALGVRTGAGDTGPLWYNSIQDAIDAARSGTKKVLVYEGTYSENLSLWEASYSNSDFRSVCGASVTTITDPDDIIFLQNVTGIVIDGFELTGGTRGIKINGATGTVSNCKIHGNNVAGRGGGINAGNSASSLDVFDTEIYSNTGSDGAGVAYEAGTGYSFTRTTIRDNNAGGDGGAVFSQNGNIDFYDSTIKDNDAGDAGGAVYSNGSDINFYRTTITGNTAVANSGVIDMPNGADDTLFENCIVANNQGAQGGVSFVNTGANFTAVNTTFVNNQATGGNGGIVFNQNATTIIRNSIIWGNTASGNGHIAHFNGGTVTITDSIISNDGDGIYTNAPYFSSGTPTISGYTSDYDPEFVDSASNDFHIKAISAAIDNASATYAPADDIDSNSRPQGSSDDIGADEYVFATNAPILAWTGETNYTSDGVDPDTAAGGTSFTFRVDYTDSDDDAPALIEVWIDEDDNNAYSSNEKYTMTETDGGDTDYTDGKLYSKAIALSMAGDGAFNYRFYAYDGSFEASGTPTSNSTVTVTNNVPSLDWTGETNYASDGANPDSAVGGTSFEFRVDYTDADNTAPSVIQIWVDEDDSGTYDVGEKYSMTETDGGDTTYTDGKRYNKSLNINYDGDGTLPYRFYASDGAADATGAAASGSSLSITNNTPTLGWTGEANYVSDGVNPDSAADGTSFEFRVDYTDTDNTAPTSIEVWVDENDNSTYEAGEKYAMTATDGGDTTYTDGKRYSKALTLSYTGDGVYNYRFYSTDGTNDATGTPVTGATVTVTFTPNNVPTLDWTGETNYTTDGVDPQSSHDSDTFTFRVKYTDADDEAPTSIQVWIDENDNTSYESGEKFNLTAADGGDTTYTDGKLYTLGRALSFAGDGVLNYRFFANDGSDDATGTPASSGGTVTVADAITVCSTGADFTTIQGAISDAGTTNGDYVRVCDGTYSENINFSGKNITVYSQNGAGSTTIQGDNSNAPVVTFSTSETSSAVLKGFTINNQNSGGASARGIAISGTAAPTIENSTIKGNNPASYANGSAIYLDAGGVTINNCTIGGDAGDKNNSRYGSAIYAINGGSAINVNDSTLSYNAASTQGGAIYISGRTSATTLTNTSVVSNTSTQNGGGILVLSSPLVIANSNIDNNQSTQPLEGGGIALSGSASTLTITGTSTVSNNSGRNGGGIHADGIGNISIANTTIDNNSATSYGAGVAFLNMGGNVTLTDTSITNNTSTAGSAGVNYSTSTTRTVTITNSTINNNTVTNTGSYDCGGLCIFPSDVSGADVTVNITGGSISGNTARNGGGLKANSGTYSSIDLNITGTVFSGNDAANGEGGAINVGGSNTVVDITKSWIKGNDAHTNGGGIRNAAVTTVTNSFITGNIAEGVSYSDGGGIKNTATLNVYSSTFAGNRAGRYGGGINGGGTITNSIFWGNVAGTSGHQLSDSPTVTYSDVGGGFAGTGNIDSDPYFADLQVATAGTPQTGGNFHICNGVDDPIAGCTGQSTVIDQGTASGSPADDYDGDTRPQGSGHDMGADELVTTGNSVPSLTWTGEANYVSDGVNPDSGAASGNFVFRVKYIDADDQAPSSIQVWVDEDDSSTYESGEKYAMTVDGGNGDYTDGELFTKTLALAYDGDGTLSYRFYASDGSADASGDPVTGSTVTVTNTAPALDWTGETNYTTDGVNPDSADSGSNFEFRVKYTDANNDAPSSIQVWIDEDDSSSYEVFEYYNLTETDGGDTDYTDGKLYSVTRPISFVGDGTFNYRFYASDGNDTATGDPISDSTITVNQTISGTVYTDEGVTTIADGATVRLIVNGVSAGTDTTVSGAYTIAGSVSSGDAIILYIDDHATDGSTVSVGDGSSITNVDIYGDRLITRHDNSGDLTNALMNTAKGAYSDADILYSVSAGNLTVSGASTELFVPNSHSFIPGGTVTTADVDINGTLDSGANAVNVSRNWDATGGVFTSSGTVTFNAVSGTATITPGGTDADHDFQNIVFNDGGGTATYQLAGAMDVDGSFTLTDGIFDTTGSNYAVTVGGNLTQSGGRVDGNGSTFTVAGNFAADGTEDSTGFNSATLAINGSGSTINYNNLASWWANGFNNLTVGQSGASDSLNNWLAVKNVLTIGTGGLSGASTLALTNTGNVLSFNASSNLTIDTLMFLNYGGNQNIPPLSNGYGCDISIAGGSGLTVTQTGAVTLNSGKDLLISGDGNADRVISYSTGEYALTIGGNLVLGAGSDTGTKTFNATNSTVTVGGDFTVNHSSNVFTSTGSTVVLNGTSQNINGSITFNNLTKSVTSADTLTFEAGETTAVNGTATLKGVSGQLLTLASSTGSSAWSFNVGSSATKDIDYVSVSWSDASGSDASQKPIGPTNSTDGGNNTDWFGAAAATTVCASGCDYTTIMAAVNASSPGETIEVGDGTYTEYVTLDNKDITLTSENGAASTTLNGQGTEPPPIRIVNGDSSTIDGFTIQNGYSGSTWIDGIKTDGHGAGVYVSGSTPTITNSIIKDGNGNNTGSGVYVTGSGSTVTVEDTTISTNTADQGGGIAGTSGTTVTLTRVTMDNNDANRGGAILFSGTALNITDSTIKNHTNIDWEGGGIYMSSGTLTMERSYVIGNSCSNGGGGIFFTGTSANITNSIISGNESSDGGGMYTSSSTTITNSTFAGNYSTWRWGALSCNGSTTARNSVFWGNYANEPANAHITGGCTVEYSDVEGGYTGTGNLNTDPLYVTSVSYTSAPTSTGNYHIQSGSPVIGQASATYAPNDDIDGESRPEGGTDDMGADEYVAGANNAPTLEFVSADCRSEGVRPEKGESADDFEFWVKYTDSDNNAPSSIQVWIDENDDSSYAAGEKYSLSEDDAGDTVYTDGKMYKLTRAVSTAGDGVLSYRFFASDGTADATGTPVTGTAMTVVSGVKVRPSSTALPKDYTSVISAINAVSGNIIVYPNDNYTAATYSETWGMYNKDNRTVISACGADYTIVSSTSTTITAQDSANFVLDGFSVTGSTSSTGININRVDSTALTIKNSKIYGNSYGIYINDSDNVPVVVDNTEIYSNNNQGIYMVNSDDDLTISNSEIHSHNISGNGAAICANNGNTVTITNTVIRNNTTSGSGGAIHVNAAGANLTIEDSSIYLNQAATGGAINMATGATTTITRTTIRDNTSTGQGGAIYTNAAGFTATNAIFADNIASTNGGAISTNSGPTVSLINSTFTGNQATDGGFMYLCSTGSTTIRNSIFWNNTASGNGPMIRKNCGSGNIGTISHSDFSSTEIFNATYTDGGGNMVPAQDPLFVDAAGDDYHLQSGSPVIDQASATYAPADDIDGDSRPLGAADDMGADEKE